MNKKEIEKLIEVHKKFLGKNEKPKEENTKLGYETEGYNIKEYGVRKIHSEITKNDR